MFKSLLAFVLAFSLLSPFKAIGHFFHSPLTIADIASDSIVRITGPIEELSPFGPVSTEYTCTGFQIATARILTAAHCIDKDMRIDGFLGSKILKHDELYDLALVEFHGIGRPPLTFRSAPVIRDEPLTGIGYASGFTRLTQIRSRALFIDYTPDSRRIAPGIFVSPAWIGGMSGGPVIDANGDVVGIVQMTFGDNQLGYGVGTLIISAFLLGT